MHFYRAVLLLLPFAATSLAAEAIPGIGPAGEVEQLSSGHGFVEGPTWDGKGSLYFTDIPNNKILVWQASGGLSTFTEQSHHANGLMFAADGRLLACEMDGQLSAWDVTSKQRTVLAEGYQGKRFNACNDLVIDSTGGVYFTDPHYRAPEPLPQGEQCVYYLDAKRQVTRVTPGLPAPNGVLLSIDEKTLYVLPSESATMRAYDVTSPGRVGEGRDFCQVKGRGGSDGAAMDTAGNLYLTTAEGVQVVSPSGEHLGTIEFPEQPANCTFGGKDNRTLYVTARTGLYAAPMEIAGHRYGGPSGE